MFLKMLTVKIGKTGITVGFSFFAVLALMLLFAQRKIVAVCLVSSLLHECGHLLFLYLFKSMPQKVIFGAFGIRIDRTETAALSYQKEAVISIGGVLVNFVLAALFLIFYLKIKSEEACCGVFVNIFIAALNLIPVGMLDAGNFLRYILLMSFDEEKTQKILLAVSDASVCVLCLLCVLYTIFVSVNISFITVCIYIISVNLKLRADSR